MATLLPSAQTTGVEAYEDMFKEITRKLYGDESAHGLYPHNTQVAQLAPGTPAAPEGGERSFTTLVSDRNLAQMDYDNGGGGGGTGGGGGGGVSGGGNTNTGTNALMQNGFPPPGAILNPVNFPVASATTTNNKQNTNINEERWQQAEEILPWNTNKNISYTAPQKIFKVKTKVEPNTSETASNNTVNIPAVQKNNTGNPGTTTSSSSSSSSSTTTTTSILKRYNCQSCPYSTDRRDLFTRHENIHKDEKPFHCYVCLKQFNRADHVKKHFLRMHREMVYDINKTRRNPAKNSKTFYQQPPQQQNQQQATLNIPTGFSSSSNTQLSQQQNNAQNHLEHNQNGMSAVNNLNSGIQQQTQQQQSQQIISIKQEKVEKSPKKKGEKRFMCCYCQWSGADNWGLKRHLNTHTKPFVCMLCDYKAARSERLATHVFKVHNKKACNKCNFFADDQAHLVVHQMETHPHDSRPPRNSNNNNSGGNGGTGNSNSNNNNTGNVLRSLGNTFVPNTSNHNSTTNSHVFGSLNSTSSGLYNSNLVDGLNSHHLASTSNSNTSQKRGAERLFQYMECDGSDPEDYARQMHMQALSRNTASVAQDFHNAGGGEKNISKMNANNSHSIYHKQQQHHMNSKNNNDKKMNGVATINITTSATSSSTSTPSISGGSSNNKAMSYIDYSPPATPITMNTNSNTTNNMKRRRKSLSNDKENDNKISKVFINDQDMEINGIGSDSKIITNNNTNNINHNINSNNNNINSKINNNNIEDIFDRLYKNSYNKFLTAAFNQFKNKTSDILSNNAATLNEEGANMKLNFSLTDFLKNNKELTISIETSNNNNKSNKTNTSNNNINNNNNNYRTNNLNAVNNNNSKVEENETEEEHDTNQEQQQQTESHHNQEQLSEITIEKRNRKQTQPRKIEKTEGNTISSIRDKHLIRLVSRRKCCRLCKHNNYSNYYHSITSLILHTKWRHSENIYKCRECKEKFTRRYKLNLHLRLKHDIIIDY